MKRLAIAFLTLLASASAQASPSLTGPLINAVTTDAQSYTAGQVAHVIATLVNNTGSVFSGNLAGVMSGRGRVVGATSTSSVTALAIGAAQTVDLAFQIPAGVNDHGYLVSLTATSGATTVDMAGAALEASADWATYPRECFVTNFTAGTSTQALVAGLNAWHCNVLQFYDDNFKHHLPYSPNLAWPNLSNTMISRTVLESYIGAAHAKRMAVFNYTLWNGAYPNFSTDGTGPSLSWGMFATNCAPSCTLANMAGTPSNGGSGGLFPAGWAAPWLAEMDPTNAAWISYFETVNAPFIRNLGYDGLQIDTLGDPGKVYNASGNVINMTTALSGFQNAVRSALNTRGVINNVSGWDEADVATNAQQDFYYRETHPEFGDTPYYPSINGLTATVRSFTNKGIDLPIYMDDTYSNTASCISGGGSTPCYFNLPGLLYIDATIFAAGAYHVYLADGDRFISNIYVPGAQLLMSPAAMQSEYDYQTFGVAMEKLLRSAVSDATQPAAITSGATGGSTGAAGQVYLLPKIRPGLQILHLLNYSQLPSNGIQDTNANQPAPTRLGAIGIKMYYSGTLTGSNLLWFASPDVNHGTPQSLSYAKGSDATGTYITFTAPSLLYWDMVWLELDGLSTSDYTMP
ncbi:glycoside hydrolase family 66 protein [Rhodopila sp.]|uniref:glycoside hydrolase family 66 protein n=1 Tax=Rhodopila sp. TaxID=2480087 RepID=UPI003D138665